MKSLRYLYGCSLLKFMEIYKYVKSGFFNILDAKIQTENICEFCYDCDNIISSKCKDCRIDPKICSDSSHSGWIHEIVDADDEEELLDKLQTMLLMIMNKYVEYKRKGKHNDKK